MHQNGAFYVTRENVDRFSERGRMTVILAGICCLNRNFFCKKIPRILKNNGLGNSIFSFFISVSSAQADW